MIGAEITADPYQELPMKTAKQASLCEELHLANRNITFLGNDFQFFINLECLWLNDNKMTNIEGLESNFRIKSLYLHGNKIRKIYPDTFEHFIALNSLTLSHNLLDDLDGCIACLKRIRNLTSLELFENFIAKEDNYKLRIIGSFTTLFV
jgi:Leucine-rich repeat (LRR) protein